MQRGRRERGVCMCVGVWVCVRERPVWCVGGVYSLLG